MERRSKFIVRGLCVYTSEACHNRREAGCEAGEARFIATWGGR